jgi:hypothetical protein
MNLPVKQKSSDRFGYRATRQYSSLARSRRKKALQSITGYSVVTTLDGVNKLEYTFDQPPTAAQIVAQFGPKAFVISANPCQRSPRSRANVRLITKQ